MSRASRRAASEKSLAALEAEFEALLLSALRRCAEGTWGMFGQNDAAHERLVKPLRDRLKSPDATALLELGEAIDDLREQLGLPKHELYHRYLEYRRDRGSNSVGEPKLAIEFLAELPQ